MGIRIFLGVLGVACAVAILVGAVRTGRPVRNLASSALGGILSLILVSVTGPLTGATLALNGWTLLFAGTAGIPGVIVLLAAKMIWGV